LPYIRTEKTKAPSFTKNFLSEHKHPLVQKIAKAREINKAHTTFIDTILKHSHRGRIHADINPIRSDQGGTVTGRFSYSNPNLQQIPTRNKELGPMIRGLFLPEEKHKWGCFDYSQQEPRLVVHLCGYYRTYLF
jgi:DNA polymerase I-like protein with 3'-5' exonuclease and polymerase domains